MAEVELKHVWKIYESGFEAVKDFNLHIKDKEFVVFVGPSGCGKSTTLRMVAGLEAISGGELYIDGQLMNHVLPKNRDISMVFQNYALYPHMTVFDNIAFPLKMRKMPMSEIKKRVEEAAAILEISDLLKRKPKALSGGQRQRVAIGRSIVREPKVFLMDEPLSNLDAKLRNQMRTELIKLRRKLNTTFIYVTHDQTEAMTLGDRIVIMNRGVIQQVGTPKELWGKPSNMFVAGFIGMPQMNFIDGELMESENGYRLFTAGAELELTETHQTLLKGRQVKGGKVKIGIRPEHLHLSENGIPASADVSELNGGTLNLHANVGGADVTAVIQLTDDDIHAPQVGTPIHLSPEPQRIHVFDPETEENLLYGSYVNE
ncbi:MAG: sn-glycerol-3-phosphate ABC transporter ATP-binding protein UgpC [Oscillospiraceae bacterium]|nr:sn-glycerol-3-phosphate ABC transporter ATP-binding protein UgpC [Oscillospiraceae bacterium]